MAVRSVGDRLLQTALIEVLSRVDEGYEPWTEFLALRHRPDGLENIGELRVTAQSNGFAGRSSAYFNDSEVIAFADALSTFPLGDPASLSGGLATLDGQYAEYVGITVAPVGSKGQLNVRVHLANGGPPEDGGFDVRLELLTTYERIRQFSLDLARVVRHEQPEARLGGERMA